MIAFYFSASYPPRHPNPLTSWLPQRQCYEYKMQSLVPWSPFLVPLLHSFEASSSLIWAWVPPVFKLTSTAHRRTTYGVTPFYPSTLKSWFLRFRQRLSSHRNRRSSKDLANSTSSLSNGDARGKHRSGSSDSGASGQLGKTQRKNSNSIFRFRAASSRSARRYPSTS